VLLYGIIEYFVSFYFQNANDMVLKPPVKRWSSLPIHYHDQSLTERGVDVLPASEKGFQVTRFKTWLKEARCLFISSIYYHVLYIRKS
jgi:hypothetical protein